MSELGLTQVAVSKHLGVLKREGIVRGEAVSNFRHYSIAVRNVIHVLNCLRSYGGKKS
jgi:DNA-binding transcriptional ArsR family regulator